MHYLFDVFLKKRKVRHIFVFLERSVGVTFENSLYLIVNLKINLKVLVFVDFVCD